MVSGWDIAHPAAAGTRRARRILPVSPGTDASAVADTPVTAVQAVVAPVLGSPATPRGFARNRKCAALVAWSPVQSVRNCIAPNPLTDCRRRRRVRQPGPGRTGFTCRVARSDRRASTHYPLQSHVFTSNLPKADLRPRSSFHAARRTLRRPRRRTAQTHGRGRATTPSVSPRQPAALPGVRNADPVRSRRRVMIRRLFIFNRPGFINVISPEWCR